MTFLAPHSRYADFPAQLIRDYTDLEILAETEEGDAYLFASKDKRIAFVTGHPEYDPIPWRQSISAMWKRVLIRMFRTTISRKRSAKQTASHLAQPRNLLFTNWLNYYVYQITPYDLRHMNPTLE
jgi:homoserine O-succinyltransferase